MAVLIVGLTRELIGFATFGKKKKRKKKERRKKENGAALYSPAAWHLQRFTYKNECFFCEMATTVPNQPYSQWTVWKKYPWESIQWEAHWRCWKVWPHSALLQNIIWFTCKKSGQTPIISSVGTNSVSQKLTEDGGIDSILTCDVMYTLHHWHLQRFSHFIRHRKNDESLPSATSFKRGKWAKRPRSIGESGLRGCDVVTLKFQSSWHARTKRQNEASLPSASCLCGYPNLVFPQPSIFKNLIFAVDFVGIWRWCHNSWRAMMPSPKPSKFRATAEIITANIVIYYYAPKTLMSRTSAQIPA